MGEATKRCVHCGGERAPGLRTCRGCVNAARRERYALDATWRKEQKDRNREWKAANRDRVAERQRQRRAAQKESA